ncbi:hypothetical protein CAF53_03415 [Sphingobium sp. LB126]|nr:hypothetical protein CAF53_03415 [Sphingobium sp. LB126]
MYNATVRSLPLAEQCRVAALTGCTALTLTPNDYLTLLNSGITTREMRTIASDHGVKLTHLDMIARWHPKWEPTHHRGLYDFALISFDIDDFLRMTDALQCSSFTAIGTHAPEPIDLPEMIDHFGALCERAAKEGLRVDLEFVPFWGVNTLECAWQVVNGANAANGGIMFDIWHYRRSHSSDDLLRTIPGSKIHSVQLNDGKAELGPDENIVEDCLFGRRLPCDGDFKVREIVAILREIGGLNNVGPEIFSTELDQMPADAIASVVRESMNRALA